MKRQFKPVKLIQLILYIAITAAALIAICTNSDLYQAVGRDPSIRVLCILLWLCLGLSFAGIFWDLTSYSSFRKQYRELDQAVYSDHVAGIANRFSCDAVIDKYVDKTLPENIGCLMMDIANLREINTRHGHALGNEVLRVFSEILSTASVGLCFVGRNGGSKFLAVFENCSEDKIDVFLNNVNRLVSEKNSGSDMPPIVFRSGRAYSGKDSETSITQLIALADRRLNSLTDRVSGISNRAGCDELISYYIGKPLPKDFGCIMFDISNIRELNEEKGFAAGNEAIRRFGDILQSTALDLCFVGRNGGTRFLALFEECSGEKLKFFLEKIQIAVENNNSAENTIVIRYRYGAAFHEDPPLTEVNRLIALAARRCNDSV